MGHFNVVKVLLENNADVNQCERQYGWSPLHFAHFGGYLDIATLLTEREANVKIRDKEGLAPEDIKAKEQENKTETENTEKIGKGRKKKRKRKSLEIQDGQHKK